MQASTRLTEKQLKDIIEAHYKAKGIKVHSVRVGYENYGGDPRETPYGYVDLTIEIPDP